MEAYGHFGLNNAVKALGTGLLQGVKHDIDTSQGVDPFDMKVWQYENIGKYLRIPGIAIIGLVSFLAGKETLSNFPKLQQILTKPPIPTTELIIPTATQTPQPTLTLTPSITSTETQTPTPTPRPTETPKPDMIPIPLSDLKRSHIDSLKNVLLDDNRMTRKAIYPGFVKERLIHLNSDSAYLFTPDTLGGFYERETSKLKQAYYQRGDKKGMLIIGSDYRNQRIIVDTGLNSHGPSCFDIFNLTSPNGIIYMGKETPDQFIEAALLVYRNYRGIDEQYGSVLIVKGEGPTRFEVDPLVKPSKDQALPRAWIINGDLENGEWIDIGNASSKPVSKNHASPKATPVSNSKYSHGFSQAESVANVAKRHQELVRTMAIQNIRT